MADINARTRLLIGTTANWAASDLVLGDGELVLERAGTAVKMKVGNGSAKFSALGYLQMAPVIPPEYLTDVEADAAYLKLTDVVTGKVANKVPRLDASGLLNTAIVPLPPAVDKTTGVADAGKLVKLAATGKIDPSMITVTTGTYRGLTDATQAVPALSYTAGDYFINTGTGLAHASWGLSVGTQVAPQQQLIYNGTSWGIVGASSGSLVRLPDGTVGSPSLAFVNDATTGLWRPSSNAMAWSVAGLERMRLDASVLRVIDGGLSGSAGANTARDAIVVEGNTNTGISLLTPNTANAGIMFGDNDAPAPGYLLYNHANDQMSIAVGGATAMVWDATYTRSVQPFLAPDGSAAAPSYGFMTQPTWGMFRLPAIGIGWSFNGVEMARLAAAGLTFSAGATVIAHNDTLTSLTLTASTGGADGTNRIVLYDSAHASNPNNQTFAGKYQLFYDTTASAANVKGGFTNATLKGEFLVGRATALNAGTGRSLIDVDGSAESLIAFAASSSKVGYMQGLGNPAGLNIGTFQAFPINFKINGVQYAALDATGTLVYTPASTNLSDPTEVGFRQIPQRVATGLTTLTRADRGKCVVQTAAANVTGNTIFLAGDVITIANRQSAGNASIGITASGMTINWGTGTGVISITSGQRTLAHNGLATLYFTADNVCTITGTGLT